MSDFFSGLGSVTAIAFFILLVVWISGKVTKSTNFAKKKYVVWSFILMMVFIFISGATTPSDSDSSSIDIATSTQTESSSSSSSSKPKAKKAKIDKHPTTIDATTKYLKHEIGDTAIDKVSMTDGILNVEYNGRSFAGKFMGSGTASNMADDLKLAQGLPLAKKGVTFLQVDTYSDNKGNEKKLLSYAIYYSRKNLDSINFANYSQVIGHTPKLLFTNATGYYVTKAMQSGKKNQIKGIDEAKIDNDAIIADYMDHYHTN